MSGPGDGKKSHEHKLRVTKLYIIFFFLVGTFFTHANSRHEKKALRLDDME